MLPPTLSIGISHELNIDKFPALTIHLEEQLGRRRTSRPLHPYLRHTTLPIPHLALPFTTDQDAISVRNSYA